MLRPHTLACSQLQVATRITFDLFITHVGLRHQRNLIEFVGHLTLLKLNAGAQNLNSEPDPWSPCFEVEL
jgi:hypothetical protein